MGREAEAIISLAGPTGPEKSGAGKILLEADALILRGAVKAQIARADIIGFAADDDDLVLQTRQGTIRAQLGTTQVALWLKALAKPPPSLADKLGIGAKSPAQVIGPLSEPALMAALEGYISTSAALLLAELGSTAAFEAALVYLRKYPEAVFWGVTVKGKSSPFSEANLRERMRAIGYIDSKSCSVSGSHSATRYMRRP